ncbi:MAG: asparagine synthase (glutamine-hydrolyzing) [Gemmatimonadales bacterium]
MCGLAGIFRLTGRPTVEDAAAVHRMMDAQVHRGPDDWGLLVPGSLATDAGLGSLTSADGGGHVRTYPDTAGAPGAILGSRRLSIIDVSERGRMPMGSADGRLWVTHNGEIYNYRELRAELDGQCPFRSQSDTEAILRGYAVWGEGMVPRLRGMFAFALFETSPRPRLLLARDRFGIKPLYYHRDRERLVFASEVRALLRSGMIPEDLNGQALIRFLQLGSVPAPQTTARGVVALAAAHALTADAQRVSSRPYWDLTASCHGSPTAPLAATRHEAAVKTRALLEESMRLHLVSDVPLGIFLSGGIDSSTLVALASRLRPERVTTLSVVFEEPDFNEAPYARLVAERYGTAHREVVLRAGDLIEGLPRMFAAMDEPTIDGINTYVVSETARRQGLTVVLSGTGADEVFLGYGHFRRSDALDRVRQVLGVLPRPARQGLIEAAVRGGAALGRGKWDRLRYLEHPSLDNAYLLVRGVFGPSQIQDLVGVSQVEFESCGAAWPPVDPARAGGALGAFGALEFTHYLQNQLLKDTDVLSMAHSIETRVPYLDHPLVEYVASLLPALKLHHHRPKPLLVEALGDSLPQKIWNRPKMGFTLPFEPWLRRHANDLEDRCLSTKWLQRSAVQEVWRQFRAGHAHWSRTWALVTLTAIEACRSATGSPP